MRVMKKKSGGKNVSFPSLPPTFTRDLAREIVKNLAAFGRFTAKPFQRPPSPPKAKQEKPTGEYPMLVDTSVFIDGRILPIVQSGFFSGTLIIFQSVLGELQHIADSSDSLRRAKGRRGLDAVNLLKRQKANPRVKVMIFDADLPDVKEVDGKLISLGKEWKVPIITVDFNLAQAARAQGIKVLNINDLSQALKVALIPGEEVIVKITHPGKERRQGVGYLTDGTMVVVEDAVERLGQDVTAIITKVHQTAAGQLFFGRVK